MQLSNYYYYFKSAISPDVCERIIGLGLKTLNQAESKGESTDAYTFGGREKAAMPDAAPQGESTIEQLKDKDVGDVYVRDSSVAWLHDQWLYDLFSPLISKANILAGWHWDIDFAENFQFTVYKPGQFYSWHKDGNSDHSGAYKRYLYGITPQPERNGKLPEGYVTVDNWVGKVRKISMTCNLNVPGEYEGGNLKFDFGHHTNQDRFHEVEEIRPQGSVVVFPSFLDHCVTPVTKGVRYSLVLWSLGKPWR